ncbi:transposase [Streptomyces paradoxus]|uniref:transposase n=1 Tax=Streptomyces paradoxus TaxID=66375 RepID=UPI0037CE6B52
MINGRKRHVAVDTKGFPVMIMVTPADMQDRDAARELLWRLRLTHPQITQVWADSAYAGQLVTWAEDFLHITLKTVSRPKGAKGFVVLPRRWRVERTLGRAAESNEDQPDHAAVPAELASPRAPSSWMAPTLPSASSKRLPRDQLRRRLRTGLGRCP